MESTTPHPSLMQNAPHHNLTAPKRSIGKLIKKYFGFIIVFFVIAITSGVLMADYEAKSTGNWEMYTSNDAGISFKHPKSFKIVEDKGWRITIYPSELRTENNIKIIYSPRDDSADPNSGETQFLANCQPTSVNELTANGTRIKIYEDSVCGGQKIPQSVIIYSENGMDYDIGIFGEISKDKLYTLLSTFTFQNKTVVPSTEPSEKPADISGIPSPSVSLSPSENVTMCTMDAKECPDGSYVGRTGPKCEFICPGGKKLQ